MLLGKIAANDADEIDGLAEERRGKGGVGCGAAEQVLGLGFGSFHVIDGDGAANDDTRRNGGGGHELMFGKLKFTAKAQRPPRDAEENGGGRTGIERGK